MKNFWHRYYPLIITAIFLLLTLFNILHHEMWRDELDAWVMARDVSSLKVIWEALRYDGTSGLWNWLVFPLGHLTHSPIVMQLLHLLLATLTIYLFNRFAPFKIINKILFTFSYYSFFEFAVISRGYILAALLLILFCILYQKWKENYLYLSLVLSFLALTSVYGLLMAIILAIIFFGQIFYVDKNKLSGSQKVLAVLIVFSGFALTLIMLIPPKDLSFANGWLLDYNFTRLKDSISIIFNTLIPIPNNFAHFWNTNILDSYPLAKFLLSILIFLITVLMLIKKRSALFFFVFAAGGIVAISYLKYYGAMRHWGHIFYILIASFWLATLVPTNKIKSKKLDFVASKLYQFRELFIGLILAASAIAGIYANCADFKYPFSSAKKTANYLRSNSSAESIIVGYPDFVMTPISGYLGKKIYFASNKSFSSFMRWDNNRPPRTPEEIYDQALGLKEETGGEVYIILNYHLADDWVSAHHIHSITSFEGAIVSFENYWLYKI